MNEGLGGTVTMGIIGFFIVLALGYAAFNVNYTKAFRMKDKIISVYEDYRGKCDSDCQEVIRDYAKKIGYKSDDFIGCPKGYNEDETRKLYCISDRVCPDTTADDIKGKCYYKIITKINLQIPVIKNFFDFKFFYIHGDTKSFAE